MNASKDLVAAVQTQQKALFIAGVSLVFFWVAPRSNELLRSGKTELDQLNKEQEQSAQRWQTESSNAATKIRESLLKSLADHDIGRSEAPLKSNVTLNTIGVVTPDTLAEHAKLTDGEAAYCWPRLEGKAILGLAPLKGQNTKFAVRGIALHGVYDAEAIAAAKTVLEKSLKVADELAALDAANVAPTVAGAPRLRPRPPEELIERRDGRATTIRNPDYDKWLAEQSALANVASAEARQKKRDELRSQKVGESARSLRYSMAELERLVHMQFDRKMETPRYAVATLTVDKVTGEDNETTETLLLPVACEPTSLQLKDAAPIAPSLRLTPEWKELRELKPAGAAKVVDASIRKGGETIEIAGFKIHEGELTKFGPFLLAGLWLWHVLHLFRLRMSSLSEADYEAAGGSPSFPAGWNRLLPCVTAALTAAVAYLGWPAPGDRAAMAATAVCLTIVLVSVILTFAPQKRAAAPPTS